MESPELTLKLVKSVYFVSLCFDTFFWMYSLMNMNNCNTFLEAPEMYHIFLFDN